jgi:hypothetical protein
MNPYACTSGLLRQVEVYPDDAYDLLLLFTATRGNGDITLKLNQVCCSHEDASFLQKYTGLWLLAGGHYIYLEDGTPVLLAERISVIPGVIKICSFM